MKKIAKTIIKRTIWVGRGTATVMGLAMLLALTVGMASTALAGTGIGARLDLGKVNVVNGVTTALQGSGPGSGTGPLLEVKREGANTGSALRVENTNTQSFAPALQLKVPSGKIPMTVNSDAGTAVGLSADKLDGKQSSEFASATNGKANDADKLDGRDSSSFADAQAGKANDADKLDGLDSSFYLKIFGKAADANLLDGRDSTAFFSGKTYQNSSEQPGIGGDFTVVLNTSCDPGDVAIGGGGAPFDKSVTMISSIPASANSWSAAFVDNGGASNFRGFVQCADLPPLR